MKKIISHIKNLRRVYCINKDDVDVENTDLMITTSEYGGVKIYTVKTPKELEELIKNKDIYSIESVMVKNKPPHSVKSIKTHETFKEIGRSTFELWIDFEPNLFLNYNFRVYFQKHTKKQNLLLVKKYLSAIAIIIISFWLSSTHLGEALVEYKLITNKKITVLGKIIKVEEYADYVESDSGQGGMRYEYPYKYSFNVKGKNITSFGATVGQPPFNIDLKDIPYNVEIEYLPKNPHRYSRIKNVDNITTSLLEWFQKRMLIRVLGLLIGLFIVYKVLKNKA